MIKLLKNKVRWIVGVLLQYLIVFSYIIFVIIFIYKQKYMLLGVIVATIVQILIYLIIRLVNELLYNPKECKILWCLRNTVYMKSFHLKDSDKNYFISDLELIISEAKKKKKKYIYMRTHFLCIVGLLEHYKGFSRKECLYVCKRLMVGEKKEFNLDIGRMKLVRISNGINICAKYEYPLIMTWNQLRKTLKETLLFDIYIYL